MSQMLSQFLNLFFLRPENAIMTYRRGVSIKDLNIDWNSGVNMDSSCGDGVFSYVVADGKFNEFFDTFLNIDENNIDELSQNKDVDIYDSDKENYKNLGQLTKNKTSYSFSIGTDWKENLLNKAKRLNFYDKLLLQDNNSALKLETESIKNIYSNSIYWVENIDLHLRELHRVLVKGGVLLLHLKTNEMIKVHPSNLSLEFASKQTLELLDRGRLSSWKNTKSIDWFLKKFENYNFKIEVVKPIYAREQVMAWHYGFRPFSHILAKIFNKLEISERTKIKNEFIQTISPIVKDLADLEPSKKDTFEYIINLVK